MPFYNVEHSFPLTLSQKTDLAERITKLHATTFKTPSIFVQVKYYQQDASANNHFVAGIPRQEATNRIIAYVRSAASRTQDQFDKLAKEIEDAWYIVLGEKFEGETQEDIDKQEKTKEETPAKEKAAKELLSIGFVPGLSGREKGFTIPLAGQEEQWFKQNRKHFEEKAELGDESFKSMLEEVDTRDDLKSWRA